MTVAFSGTGHRLGGSSPIGSCFSSFKSCGQGLVARVKAVWNKMDRMQKALLGLAALSFTALLLTGSASVGSLATALLTAIFFTAVFRFIYSMMQ